LAPGNGRRRPKSHEPVPIRRAKARPSRDFEQGNLDLLITPRGYASDVPPKSCGVPGAVPTFGASISFHRLDGVCDGIDHTGEALEDVIALVKARLAPESAIRNMLSAEARVVRGGLVDRVRAVLPRYQTRCASEGGKRCGGRRRRSLDGNR
jgi:hypothetical protein